MKKTLWLLCCSLLVFCCCTHGALKGRLVKRHDATIVIAKAKSLYTLGEMEAAIVVLRNFVNAKTYHPSHDLAYELLIDWLLQQKRTTEARTFASYFLTHHPASTHGKKIVGLFEQKGSLMTDESDLSPNELPEE